MIKTPSKHKNMNRKGLYNQYTWVMNVLDSCENPQQVETAQKLFALYLKKWDKDMSNGCKSTFVNNFDKEKRTKHLKLKKTGSFFSKFSQLFLF